jgi:hypothetical protein
MELRYYRVIIGENSRKLFEAMLNAVYYGKSGRVKALTVKVGLCVKVERFMLVADEVERIGPEDRTQEKTASARRDHSACM